MNLKRSSGSHDKETGKYYTGSIPHVAILDPAGKAVYNAAGEVEELRVSAILNKLLQ